MRLYVLEAPSRPPKHPQLATFQPVGPVRSESQENAVGGSVLHQRNRRPIREYSGPPSARFWGADGPGERRGWPLPGRGLIRLTGRPPLQRRDKIATFGASSCARPSFGPQRAETPRQNPAIVADAPRRNIERRCAVLSHSAGCLLCEQIECYVRLLAIATNRWKPALGRVPNSSYVVYAVLFVEVVGGRRWGEPDGKGRAPYAEMRRGLCGSCQWSTADSWVGRCAGVRASVV
jgi:hypothetical protein